MLKDQIQQDIIAAMKAKDELKKNALKMIKAEIMKLEVSGANIVADDQKVIAILQRAVKQRKEAEKGFLQGGNEPMALKEAKEAEIYAEYLPKQMSEEDIKKIVEKTISEIGAEGPSDMGKVMGVLMPKVKGKANGDLVKQVVQTCLND